MIICRAFFLFYDLIIYSINTYILQYILEHNEKCTFIIFQVFFQTLSKMVFLQFIELFHSSFSILFF